jgi:hypothetical protein
MRRKHRNSRLQQPWNGGARRAGQFNNGPRWIIEPRDELGGRRGLRLRGGVREQPGIDGEYQNR